MLTLVTVCVGGFAEIAEMRPGQSVLEGLKGRGTDVTTWIPIPFDS